MNKYDIYILLVSSIILIHFILDFIIRPLQKVIKVSIEKHCVLLLCTLCILFIVMEVYYLSIIYGFITGMRLRLMLKRREFKEILRQAYEYHGSADYVKMMRQDYPFLEDKFDLEKLKKQFDAEAMDNDNNG